MKNRLKNQKGVISVFAMLAMLFFLLFILGSYLAVSRSNRTQKEANEEVLKIYSTEVNAQDVYDSMITTSYEVVPIYTYEQADCIGNSQVFWAINGKIYDFQNKSHDLFELKTNLNIPFRKDSNANSYKYSDSSFDRGEYSYVDYSSLLVSLDGINNTGEGFSETAAAWTNLVSTDKGYFYAFDIFGGGTEALQEGEINWTGEGLAFDGAGDYVLANNIMYSGNSAHTFEIVFKTNSSSYQRLIGNWGDETGGGLSLSGNQLFGEYFLEGNIRKNVTSDVGFNIQTNQITHAAITYDGKSIGLYKNGEKISQSSGIKSNESNFTSEKQFTTLGIVESTIADSSNIIKMKMQTYIGKTGETSANGITIAPAFLEGGECITPVFNEVTPSRIYVNNSSSYIKDTVYYQNISDITDDKTLKFSYNVIADGKNINLVWDDENLIKLGIPKEDESEQGSFSIFCTGSDSVIIRSNIGKIQTWYFNGKVKSPVQNNGEVQILGTYYYVFDGLDPNTSYSVKAKFAYDGSQKKYIKPVEGKYTNSIFIGNSLSNKYYIGENEFYGGAFDGIIYAVRVYDKVLTTDQIKSNYNVDKSRFSIVD